MLGGRKLKSKWWNDNNKTVVEGNEVSWSGILGAKDEIVKERLTVHYEEENITVKR